VRGEIHTGFLWESQKEGDHYEDLDVRWDDNIKMDCKEIEWGGMDWTDLAQDKDQWRALANTVMNLSVP
jgi:hypothetical protein